MKSDSNSEEELIDLDKALPLKKESNWLLESNNYSNDFHVTFSDMHFSNPLIKNFIKTIYLNGKSKQVLHHLMYWNDRMTISCDNCSYLCRNNNVSSNAFIEKSRKRHSLIVTTSHLVPSNCNNESESLTDSLDSIESINYIDRSSNINVVCDRMTQSSITDYNVKSYIPQESEKLPLTKHVSSSQNVLSRTYDKEDLEILKQTELSNSVFVPHISGSKIDHYSQIEISQKTSAVSVTTRNKIPESCKTSSFKRLFPMADSDKISKESSIQKPRPNSMYQIDKLSKNTIDRCIKISQQKQLKFSPHSLLKMNENIFETDVLTPINSPRYLKNLTINKPSKLKSPMSKSFIN